MKICWSKSVNNVQIPAVLSNVTVSDIWGGDVGGLYVFPGHPDGKSDRVDYERNPHPYLHLPTILLLHGMAQGQYFDGSPMGLMPIF